MANLEVRPVDPDDKHIRPLFPQVQALWQKEGMPAKKVQTVRELIKMLKKLDGDRPINVAAVMPTILVEDNLIFGERYRPGLEMRSLDIVSVVDNERDEEDGVDLP
jgi:hypothetical protein